MAVMNSVLWVLRWGEVCAVGLKEGETGAIFDGPILDHIISFDHIFL